MAVIRKVSLTGNLQKVFETMRLNSAYVGVPASAKPRSEGEQITNAELAYIHEKGAPAANIPARPFLTIGVKNSQSETNKILTNGIVDAMRGVGESAVLKALAQAGTVAANSVQKVLVTSGALAPLQPSTIRRRQAKRKRKDGPNLPLLDTTQLRQSITWVVRKVKV